MIIGRFISINMTQLRRVVFLKKIRLLEFIKTMKGASWSSNIFFLVQTNVFCGAIDFHVIGLLVKLHSKLITWTVRTGSKNEAKLTFLNTSQIKLVVHKNRGQQNSSKFCTFGDIFIIKNSLKIFKTSEPLNLIIWFVTQDWIAQISDKVYMLFLQQSLWNPAPRLPRLDHTELLHQPLAFRHQFKVLELRYFFNVK